MRILTLAASVTGATLNLGVSNTDSGAPAGTLDVFAFSGDGIVSTDEWGLGSLLTTFTGISGAAANLIVDVSILVADAVSTGLKHVSFRLSSMTSDRYVLDHVIGGVAGSIAATGGPSFISVETGPAIVASAPSIFILFLIGLICTICLRRR